MTAGQDSGASPRRGIFQLGSQVGTPTIKITTHLWIQWARVALDNFNAAGRHRTAAATARQTPGRSGFSESLLGESSSSMVAICAAAFSVEALISAMARVVMPPATVAKWETLGGRGTKPASRVREVLKNSVGNSGVAESLADRWEPIFGYRHNAVHFLEVPAVPVPHPLGTNVSPEDAMYRYENAQEAVQLLIETLEAVHSAPRPAIASWIANFSAIVSELRRGVKPSV